MAGPEVGALALEWAGVYSAAEWQRYVDRFASEADARRFREVVERGVGRRQGPAVLGLSHAWALRAARRSGS